MRARWRLIGRGVLEPDRWARRGDAEAVFLNQRGGRLTRQGLWLVVRRHGEAAGIGSLLTPHVLRHSCATHMLDGGADIRFAQEMLVAGIVPSISPATARTSFRRFNWPDCCLERLGRP